MLTIASRFNDVIEREIAPQRSAILGERELFSLSYEIFVGSALSTEVTEMLESALPPRSLFFLVNGGRFIHPENFEPISAETIWETIRGNKAGVFHKQIYRNRPTGELSYALCTACLGPDKEGNEIAAGLIYSEIWDDAKDNEEQFAKLISRIKRFYEEFVGSKVLCKLLKDESSFAYIIDAVTNDIILSRIPSKHSPFVAPSSIDRQMMESLVPRILNPGASPAAEIAPGGLMRNLNMAKCRILDHEYVLLSFQSLCDKDDVTQPYLSLHSLSEAIREKLSDAEMTLDRSTLHSGKIIGNDDVAMLTTARMLIQETKKLAAHIEKYGTCASSEYKTD